MAMVEPKAKKKYNTKKENEKDAVMEKLIVLGQTMVGEELHDEEAQSIRDMVEEATRPLHAKVRKNTTPKCGIHYYDILRLCLHPNHTYKTCFL